MTNQDQQTTILDRRTYLIAAYDRLRSRIGEHSKTDLKDIISLSILHVQISQTLEALAERSKEEVQQ